MAESSQDYDPASYNHKVYEVKCVKIKLHYVDHGEGTDKVVVLLHGWPELWYSWRKQIKVMSKAGYRVIVPDLPGFGQTVSDDKDLSSTTHKSTCAALNELLASLGIKKFAVIGHDWGGALAWNYAVYHPELLNGVASICTPYWPRSPVFVPMEMLLKKFPHFAYQAYFGSEKAVKELDGDVEKLFACIFRRPGEAVKGFTLTGDNGLMGGITGDVKPSDMLSAKEMEYYVSQYKARGFRGGLNWYRTRKLNWEDGAGYDVKIEVPALMVTAGADKVLTPAMSKGMEKFIPNLSRANVETAGHWMIVQETEQANKILLDWLKTVYSN